MNPRLPSPALFWANSPESVFLALRGHCTHKVARAPEKSTHIHLQTKLHPQSYQGPWTSEYHPLLRQRLSLPRTALIHPTQSKTALRHPPDSPRKTSKQSRHSHRAPQTCSIDHGQLGFQIGSLCHRFVVICTTLSTHLVRWVGSLYCIRIQIQIQI